MQHGECALWPADTRVAQRASVFRYIRSLRARRCTRVRSPRVPRAVQVRAEVAETMSRHVRPSPSAFRPAALSRLCRGGAPSEIAVTTKICPVCTISGRRRATATSDSDSARAASRLAPFPAPSSENAAWLRQLVLLAASRAVRQSDSIAHKHVRRQRRAPSFFVTIPSERRCLPHPPSRQPAPAAELACSCGAGRQRQQRLEIGLGSAIVDARFGLARACTSRAGSEAGAAPRHDIPQLQRSGFDGGVQ